MPAARDTAVDLIKGMACLLMIVAHVPFGRAPWLAQATLGSVLFFASTGMNFEGILDRHAGDDLRLAGNALFLIFAGFADNYVLGTMGQSDVFQSAGMAMLAMLALRHLTPRYWTWLFPLPFFIHHLNQHVYHWKISAGGLSSFFLTPGLFPLLPWLSFYLLGAHLKRNRPEMAWGVAAGALALVPLRPWVFNKFWMSTDYWLLGCAAAALGLLAARGVMARAGRCAELRLWGANSLAFYILQGFVVRFLEQWLRTGWLLAASLAATVVLLRGGIRLQTWTRRLPAPAVLGVCGAVSALVVARGWHEWAAFGLTFAFLAAYPAWKNLTLKLRRRAAGARPRPTATREFETAG